MPEVQERTQVTSGKKKRSILWQVVKYTVIAFVIMLPVRIFVAEPFVVSGDSMAPTFNDSDYLVVDKLYYRYEPPQRNDVVIFRYPLNPQLFFIKRIVGLPGETVEVEGGIVSITEKDGTRHILDGSHLTTDTDGQPPQPIITTLASDEYFVLGDNRDASSDSRDWGPLQAKYIVGRALFRVFPLNEAGFLPGENILSQDR